jgi:hypothetical protein
MDVERREYGPECTPVEQAAIKSRVEVLENGIIRYRELPMQTPFSVDLMHDRMEELVAGWERFGQVVDLTCCRRPDAATRARVKQRIRHLRPRLVHVAVIVGANSVIRAVASIVGYALGVTVTLHPTEEKAFEAVRNALR